VADWAYVDAPKLRCPQGIQYVQRIDWIGPYWEPEDAVEYAAKQWAANHRDRVERELAAYSHWLRPWDRNWDWLTELRRTVRQ